MEPARFVTKTKTVNSSAILTVTDRAAQELKTALAGEKEPYAGLRLGVESGGCCGMMYSLGFVKTADQNDMVVEQGGLKFYVSQDDAKLLSGAKVDFVDTPAGSGFHIENPNAEKSGGHGHGHGHGGGGCGSGGGCGCSSGGAKDEEGCGC